VVAYLDYAASAPLRPEAADAWARAAAPGNPSSLHAAGREARSTVEAARETVAESFGAAPAEVLFTSGGTESCNLALAGIFHARQADAPRPHVLVSAVEHPAIGEAARLLASRHGAILTRLEVDPDGIVRVEMVADLLEQRGDGIGVISVMGANNETGAIQPLPQIVALAQARGVPVHSDLVHVAGKVPIEFGASGLAAASISAHKLGGPAGIGALLARRSAPLAPVFGGGGQERRVRSGTLDARSAAGFAAAASLASREAAGTPGDGTPARAEQLLEPLDRWVRACGGVAVNRTPPAHVPGTRLVTVPGCSAEVMTYVLDREGVAVSAGSACSAGVVGPSPVLEAMGLGPEETASGLRCSVGWASTPQDVARLLDVLPRAIALAREAGGQP
jgi:cysteine desulfurase